MCVGVLILVGAQQWNSVLGACLGCFDMGWVGVTSFFFLLPSSFFLLPSSLRSPSFFLSVTELGGRGVWVSLGEEGLGGVGAPGPGPGLELPGLEPVPWS